MAAHATLSPSSAHEWMNCALSIKMRKEFSHLDPNRYGIASAQGTIKHHVIEQCLIRGVDPYEFVGQEFRLGDLREEDEDMPQEWADFTYEFTEDDADVMITALDEIDEYPGEMFVENRVNLSNYCGPNQFGTLDLAIISPVKDSDIEEYDILIWDNKFGRVSVNAIENLQLMLYALGFWDNVLADRKIRIRKFIIRIWQPYVRGGGGEWSIGLSDLRNFGDRVRVAAKKAMGDDPVANPGPTQCEYCIGAKLMKCEAYVKWNTNIMKSMLCDDDDLDDLVEKDQIPCMKYSGVDPVMRTWILDNFDMFSRFVERLAEQAFTDAYYGRETPGLRLGYGNKSRRKYRDIVEATDIVIDEVGEDKAFTKRLIGPAQLEKLVGRKRMVELGDIVQVGKAKLILVPEGDSRPRVPSIRDMLMDEE